MSANSLAANGHSALLSAITSAISIMMRRRDEVNNRANVPANSQLIEAV